MPGGTGVGEFHMINLQQSQLQPQADSIGRASLMSNSMCEGPGEITAHSSVNTKISVHLSFSSNQVKILQGKATAGNFIYIAHLIIALVNET